MGTGEQLALLRKTYGPVKPAEPRDPFELIVWENAGYLVDDERRTAVFESLRRAVGVTPLQIVAAGSQKIEAAIEGGGMQPAHRAAKVMRCAEIALELAGGNLASSLKTLPVKKARALLKRFPGIGDPGAAKILLLCGFDDQPALESNGLRVLGRVGAIAENDNYTAMYREGIACLDAIGVRGKAAIDAFMLLRAHGRDLCKRNGPLCAVCPLASSCRYAVAATSRLR